MSRNSSNGPLRNPRFGWAAALITGAALITTAKISRPTASEVLLDEIGSQWKSTRRWFGMVSDLQFNRAADGSLEPRFETLHSPLVHAKDGANQSLDVALPPMAHRSHRIALASAPGVSVTTVEPALAQSAAQIARGMVVYPGALAGGDLLYKLTPTHVDEYLYLREPPPRLVRRVRLEIGPEVGALREAPGFVEVADRRGTTRLRAGAPLARAADGKQRKGVIRLDGQTLVLEVDLSGLVAPVLIDPDWASTGSMTVGHWSDAAWVAPGGQVLAVAGCALSGCPTTFAKPACGEVLADSELWSEASATWQAGPPLAQARYAFGSADLGASFLVAGGCITSAGDAFTATAERYSPADRAWSAAGVLQAPRGHLMGAPLPGGGALMAGGVGTSGAVAAADVYDPDSNAWRTAAQMRSPRAYASLTALSDGRVLVAGGCANADCSTIQGDAEIYDPSTDRWSPAGALITARAGHAATLLPDGRVLLSGGCGDGACRMTLPSAEIFTPGAGFSAAATMPGARHDHTATLLATGQVLVAGGAMGPASSIPRAEVYLPDLDRWIAVEDMMLDRAYHVAALLPSGKVLAAGGCNPTTCMPWCEVFTPDRLPGLIAALDGGPESDGGASSGSDGALDEDAEAPDSGPPPRASGPHPALFRSGMSYCATSTTENLPCPAPGFPLQDGDHQPNARLLVATSTTEISDPSSGLIWQATDDGASYDLAGARAHCALFGRLPSVIELMTIVHYGRNNPSIDPAFATAQSTNYWTDTPVSSGGAQNWTVKFDYGELVPLGQSRQAPARCVKGGTPSGAPAGRVRQAGPFTLLARRVQDPASGLEWQLGTDGVRRTWKDALAYCASLRLDGLAGWHLPNVDELRSIAEFGPNPSGGAVIDPAFQPAPADLFWTSTPNDGSPSLSWSVSFNLGIVDGVNTIGLAFARCVRHYDGSMPGPGPTLHVDAGNGSTSGGGCGCRTDPGAPLEPAQLLGLLGLLFVYRARSNRRKPRS
jgi:MYXO-CTERM domain-containing protein